VVVGPASGVVSVTELQAAGVKRISLGSAVYTSATAAVNASLKAAASGDLVPVATGVRGSLIVKMIEEAAAT